MYLLMWAWFFVKRRVVKIWLASVMIARGQTSKYPAIVTRFERDFAALVGVRHAATMSNGTSGLEAALFALGVGPGDEVISPSYTIHSTFMPALTLGASVRFADISPDTLTVDPAEIERLITPRTKAIIVVHTWGNPVDMDAITAIARLHGLRIVEDCSHCHGARWGEKALGSIGDIGVFSLQKDKPVAAGEGGVVVTDSSELMDRVLAYGHQGRRVSGTLTEDHMSDFFPGTGAGRKCRAHPLAIALAKVDLDTLPTHNKLNLEAWSFVRGATSESSTLRLQRPQTGGTMAGFCLGAAVRLVDNGVSPEEAMDLLRAAGISVSRRANKPNHHWPHLYDRRCYDAYLHGQAVNPIEPPQLPHTERAMTHVMFLPLHQFAFGRRRRALRRAVTALDHMSRAAKQRAVGFNAPSDRSASGDE